MQKLMFCKYLQEIFSLLQFCPTASYIQILSVKDEKLPTLKIWQSRQVRHIVKELDVASGCEI